VGRQYRHFIQIALRNLLCKALTLLWGAKAGSAPSRLPVVREGHRIGCLLIDGCNLPFSLRREEGCSRPQLLSRTAGVSEDWAMLLASVVGEAHQPFARARVLFDGDSASGRRLASSVEVLAPGVDACSTSQGRSGAAWAFSALWLALWAALRVVIACVPWSHVSPASAVLLHSDLSDAGSDDEVKMLVNKVMWAMLPTYQAAVYLATCYSILFCDLKVMPPANHPREDRSEDGKSRNAHGLAFAASVIVLCLAEVFMLPICHKTTVVLAAAVGSSTMFAICASFWLHVSEDIQVIEVPPTGRTNCGPGDRRGTIPHHTRGEAQRARGPGACETSGRPCVL
jgi:hypothetical protein